MSNLDRRNAATFARCQARYDAMQPPEYYAEDPPPCEICGYDTDGDKREEKYLCPDCIKEWYSCPECEAKYWHKADTKNELCDDCKEKEDAE